MIALGLSESRSKWMLQSSIIVELLWNNSNGVVSIVLFACAVCRVCLSLPCEQEFKWVRRKLQEKTCGCDLSTLFSIKKEVNKGSPHSFNWDNVKIKKALQSDWYGQWLKEQQMVPLYNLFKYRALPEERCWSSKHCKYTVGEHSHIIIYVSPPKLWLWN